MSNEASPHGNCKKCGSASTFLGKRGWSVMTGLIGANSKRIICGECGAKWKPGKN